MKKHNIQCTENKITKERPIVKIITKKAIKVEKREGLPIMPLQELVTWCKSLCMDSVLEQLDELYHLGLKTKYAEINTNT